MTIRGLLITLLTLLGMLILIVSSGELRDVRAKRDAAQWILQSNQLADLTLGANGEVAMERGITAVILAHPDQANSAMLHDMVQQRHASDVKHQAIIETASRLAHLSANNPEHPIHSGIAELEQRYAALTAARHELDQHLANETASTLTNNDWFTLSTQLIDAQVTLRNATSQPMPDNLYSHTANPTIKGLLFSVSEYAGRERALIGAAIAQPRELSDEERNTLRRYRNIVEAALERSTLLLQQLPPSEELSAAQEAMNTLFLTEFEQLRRNVYAADRLGLPYPVSAEEWYRQATLAIGSTLALSETVSGYFILTLDRLEKSVTRSMLLVSITILTAIAIFLFTAWSIQRRILLPLQRLKASANRVAGGALKERLPSFRNDEIGSLARAFEEMRCSLVDDIERREASEAELRKLNLVIEQSVSAIAITDANGIIEYVNPQFTRTTGFDANQLIGKRVPLLAPDAMPRQQYLDMRRTLLQGKVWESELRCSQKNGEERWEMITINPVRNEHGLITHFVGIQYDISDRKRMEEQIKLLAYYDELTGLPNRALLAKRFDQVTQHAQQRNRLIALLSLDISRFHLINDSLGHQIGDKVLQAVARRLTECARPHDIVTRYAADEFVVLLADAVNHQDIASVAQRIIESIQRPLIIEKHELNISMYAGISVMSEDGHDLATLLRNATTAMHMATRQSERKFYFFTQELNVAALQRLALEQELHRALEQRSLELYYQPKVSLTSGKVVGLEALARWQHPTEGNISPLDFIPVAEETGLIYALGEWALREACEQTVAWQRKGLPALTMAVNLSVRQLQRPGLVVLIKHILEETGLDPALLELELTESAMMDRPEKTIATLNELKALGVRLAVDDFGTGYSSLAYLRRFPFDTLKIDRSFISDIATTPDEAALTQTIIAMGRGLRLEIVAEGVETEAQVEFLRRHHCDLIQGYLFSPPLPAKQITELLRQTPRCSEVF